MSGTNKLRVSFKAPLRLGDTETMTVGCRANNSGICKNNGIPGVCAFEREDGMCHMPSKAWKKQYLKLSSEKNHDAE